MSAISAMIRNKRCSNPGRVW